MEKLHLGAYQTLDLQSHDLGEQYTEGGTARRTMVVKLTTAMDEHFVNRTVTALLTEQAQRDIIEKLQANLAGEDL
ncbi:MAG TPA: hypothetical protein VNS88_14270 [Nitrospiraceae bacterium]|nr:hypothetical protein [Nitrospiraceae bacterium]